MEAKEGYIKTELGWIPEDWQTKPLGTIGEFMKGKGIAKKDLIDEGIPCVRYGEIYTVHHWIIKRFYSFIDLKTASQSFEIQNNDILFAGSGETVEEIGKAVAYLGNEPAYAGGDTIVFRAKNIQSAYLSAFLNSDKSVKQKRQMGQGNSVVHIYSRDLKNLLVPLPPLPEQQKIAEILTTVDDKISSIEDRIQQTEQLKKGLMEKLLTEGIGHTEFKYTEIGRIPMSWNVVKLQDVIIKMTNGFVGTASPFYTESSDGVIYLMSRNIRANKIDETTIIRVSKEFSDSQSKAILRKDDLLTVQSGHIGTSCVVPEKFFGANCHALILTRFKNDIINPLFVSPNSCNNILFFIDI